MLKKSHPYFYQVLGLLAITGLQWCDFIVCNAHYAPGRDISVERRDFDQKFWEAEMLPALLYFYKRAVVQELLTRRVERLSKLHAEGAEDVPFYLFQNGYFTTHAAYSLKNGHSATYVKQSHKKCLLKVPVDIIGTSVPTAGWRHLLFASNHSSLAMP